MSSIPENLKYVDSHEWLRLDNDGIVTIGITEHAKDLLGEVVFVELPHVGTQLAKGANSGLVESVKAVSEIYCPIAGEVIDINPELEFSPEYVSEEPYEDGWLFRVKANNVADLEQLLTAKQYAKLIEDE